MALSGLDIFKLLPKTNCGDCGVPTCLAFAMKLAQKQAELSQCPHASDEATGTMGAASEPPMRKVKIGAGEMGFEIGGETEMFRHEKTFYHETAIMVRIDDTQALSTIATLVKQADEFIIERIGENLRLNGFCLSNVSREHDLYLGALDTVITNSSLPIILDCSSQRTIQAALEKLAGRRPLIRPVDLVDRGGPADPVGHGDLADPVDSGAPAKAQQFVDIAREAGAGLIVSADSFDDLAQQTEAIARTGFKDILLDLSEKGLGERLQNNTIVRRAALRKGFKSFGFPLISFIDPDDEHMVLADSVVNLCKYSGIIVLPGFNRELLLTLYALRQNIYTDPQKPIQMDPRLYAIGEPGPEAPVFVTTNFSLTYFIVSGELENSGISAWLVIPDCEGMSVLTAWAAGKFTGQTIGKFVERIKLAEQVTSRKLVIPGHVASISGDLEEALPEWEIIVGPQEAADLASFISHHSLG